MTTPADKACAELERIAQVYLHYKKEGSLPDIDRIVFSGYRWEIKPFAFGFSLYTQPSKGKEHRVFFYDDRLLRIEYDNDRDTTISACDAMLLQKFCGIGEVSFSPVFDNYDVYSSNMIPITLLAAQSGDKGFTFTDMRGCC